MNKILFLKGTNQNTLYFKYGFFIKGVVFCEIVILERKKPKYLIF